ERSTGGGWTQIGTVGANVTTYSDTTAAANTTYFYRVRAYAGSVNSAYSNQASTTTPAPAAPGGLAATVASASQVNLSWADNAANETGFTVQRSLDGVNWFDVGAVAANVRSYSDTTALANSTYYYRVRATNGAGSSAYSNQASATTP